MTTQNVLIVDDGWFKEEFKSLKEAKNSVKYRGTNVKFQYNKGQKYWVADIDGEYFITIRRKR